MDEILPTKVSRQSQFCVYIHARNSRRVDLYLSALFADMSRSYVQRLIVEGSVLVGEIVAHKNFKVSRGDIITIEWKVEDAKFGAEPMDIEVIYDSTGFAVINKDPGMNVHPVPGEGGKSGTLVNGLLHHFGPLSVIWGEERPGLVHRLDRDTSGLMLIAKDDKTLRELARKIERRTISKRYLAVVIWEVPEDELSIESYIGRDPADRKRMTALNPLLPKLARTRAFVRERRDGYSLLEVDLLTGRTHQIRVHLASIGFPIVGDKIYGRSRENELLREGVGLTRQWLHAWKLEFTLWGDHHQFCGPLKEDLPKMGFSYFDHPEHWWAVPDHEKRPFHGTLDLDGVNDELLGETLEDEPTE